MGSQVMRRQGRRKLEIVKMAKESNLQVTFSKRRAGLFKKGSELATLCGEEVGLVVFSPGKKAFSFGHPNINRVANKFLQKNVVYPTTTMEDRLTDERIQGHISELDEVERQLKIEQQRADQLDQYKKKYMPQIDKLDNQGLCLLQDALRMFKKEIDGKMLKAVDNDIGPTIPYSCQEHN